MQDLWQSKGVGRLLGGGLEATVVVLLADLAWLWAKTAIADEWAQPRALLRCPLGAASSL